MAKTNPKTIEKGWRSIPIIKVLQQSFPLVGELYALACILVSDIDGYLMISDSTPYTPEMFALLEHLPADNAQAIFDLMVSLGFLKLNEEGIYYLTNGNEYNMIQNRREINAASKRKSREVREPKKETSMSEIGKRKNRSPDNGNFPEFWNNYPKQMSWAKAEKAYRTALKVSCHTDIMKGLRANLRELKNREHMYVPAPATWLANQGWRDVPAKPKETAAKVNAAY